MALGKVVDLYWLTIRRWPSEVASEDHTAGFAYKESSEVA